MKKEILTCDMCGTIIQGPGDRNTFRSGGVVEAAVPHGSKNRTVYKIDICEDDAPWELFDDGNLTLLFGGETLHEGELIELQERHVVAVIESHPARMTTTAYSLDDLNGEQRSYVERAADTLRETWQKELNNNPRYDRNP